MKEFIERNIFYKYCETFSVVTLRQISISALVLIHHYLSFISFKRPWIKYELQPVKDTVFQSKSLDQYQFQKIWAVIVAQLAERFLLIPEVRGLNPVIGEILKWTCLLITVEKMKRKKEANNCPFFYNSKRFSLADSMFLISNRWLTIVPSLSAVEVSWFLPAQTQILSYRYLLGLK